MTAMPLKSLPASAAPGVRRASLGLRLWHALEAAGHRRAARELRERAARYAATDPGLAAELNAAADHALKAG
jgi:hypothetical protein